MTYLDFDKILATCRLDSTTSEYEFCMNFFPKLLQLYYKEGHVEGNVFEEIEFTMDVGITENNVTRIIFIH